MALFTLLAPDPYHEEKLQVDLGLSCSRFECQFRQQIFHSLYHTLPVFQATKLLLLSDYTVISTVFHLFSLPIAPSNQAVGDQNCCMERKDCIAAFLSLLCRCSHVAVWTKLYCIFSLSPPLLFTCCCMCTASFLSPLYCCSHVAACIFSLSLLHCCSHVAACVLHLFSLPSTFVHMLLHVYCIFSVFPLLLFTCCCMCTTSFLSPLHCCSHVAV